MNEPKIGQTLSRDYIVTPADLAPVIGSGNVEVLATPRVIAMMEGVAAELAQQYVDDNCTTVGTEINVQHTAATAAGAPVKITAELTAAEGRKFHFALQAFDNAGPIATGTHERVSIKRASFAAKAQERREK